MNKMFKFFESKNTRRLRAILTGLGFTDPNNLKHVMEMKPDELFETFRKDQEEYKKLLIAYNVLVNEKYLRGRPHSKKD